MSVKFREWNALLAKVYGSAVGDEYLFIRHVVNEAIKPYQTEGVYHGKRDIHRRPFEVCAIPEFDSANPDHMKIVALAKTAKAMMEKSGPSMEGGLAKVRETSRKLLRVQIGAIDDMVTAILGSGPKPVEPKSNKAAAQDVMF